MLVVYIYRRNFLLKTTPFMKFIHTVHTQLVQSLYLRNFPWNEIKIYCIIVIKMFLALSPIILCSIHPWFWNALYNVYIISYQWRREERDDERQLEESYFVYSAIFYESLKVTVNASCKFKDRTNFLEDDLIELMKRISWSDRYNHTNEFFEILLLDSPFIRRIRHFLMDFCRVLFVEKVKIRFLSDINRSERLIKMMMMIVWLLFRVNRGFITQ